MFLWLWSETYAVKVSQILKWKYYMNVFHVPWNAHETVFHEMPWKKSFTVYPCLKKFFTRKNKKQKKGTFKSHLWNKQVFHLAINGTERYKEAINHMCSLKYLIRYSEITSGWAPIQYIFLSTYFCSISNHSWKLHILNTIIFSEIVL